MFSKRSGPLDGRLETRTDCSDYSKKFDRAGFERFQNVVESTLLN